MTREAFSERGVVLYRFWLDGEGGCPLDRETHEKRVGPMWDIEDRHFGLEHLLPILVPKLRTHSLWPSGSLLSCWLLWPEPVSVCEI